MGNVILKRAYQDTHLQCMDSIISVGQRVVGDPKMAETFLNRFDECTAATYEAAPDISARED